MLHSSYVVHGLCSSQVTVHPSVCPLDRQQQQHDAGLLYWGTILRLCPCLKQSVAMSWDLMDPGPNGRTPGCHGLQWHSCKRAAPHLCKSRTPVADLISSNLPNCMLSCPYPTFPSSHSFTSSWITVCYTHQNVSSYFVGRTCQVYVGNVPIRKSFHSPSHPGLSHFLSFNLLLSILPISLSVLVANSMDSSLSGFRIPSVGCDS